MANKKPLSEVQKDYNKQRKRLENYIKKSEKEGYIFPSDPLPKIPKKVTKASVNKLANIKSQTLRQEAQFVIHETGEIVPVKGNKKAIATDIQWQKQQKEQEKQDRKEQYTEPEYPKWTETVINNWEKTLDVLHTSDRAVGYGLLKAWEDTIISKNGRDSFADMLQTGADAGNMLSWEIVYHGNLTLSYISSMMDYLPDSGVIYKEDVLDKMQFMENLANAFEDSYEE